MNKNTNPQLVFSWTAPLRPFKKRSRLIIRFYVAVTLLLSLIIFFFGDRILLIPLGAIMFLFYVLTVTPPPDVDNKITHFGIEIAEVALHWESLSYFYFTKRFGFNMLTIVSKPPYFYHVYAVVPNEEIKTRLMTILSEHLLFQEKPQKSITDKIVDALSTLIPDEEESIEATSQVASSKPQQAPL